MDMVVAIDNVWVAVVLFATNKLVGRMSVNSMRTVRAIAMIMIKMRAVMSF